MSYIIVELNLSITKLDTRQIKSNNSMIKMNQVRDILLK